MTATDTQVRILMREHQKGKTQEQAAASGNLHSRNTVTKYEGLGESVQPVETDAHVLQAGRSLCGDLGAG